MPELSVIAWVAVVLITVLAGFVKGAVGFAMPMIMISGLGSILDPKLALAALIVPTLVTNTVQALRNGTAAAFASANDHKSFIACVLIMIALSSQLVAILPSEALFLIIGVPVVVFALVQLVGVKVTIPPNRRTAAELSAGGFAGFVGGLSGVWGPPTVLYLTALDTPKVEQMRVQGIVYGIASVALVLAHIKSGIFNAATAPLSALLLVPALVGVAAGFRTSDALNQALFRRATLAVLVIAGLNLIRRGLFG